MIDITVLAAGAAALLSPFLRRATDEFAGEAGRNVWASTERLFSRIKQAFRSDKADAAVLARYEREPDAAAAEFAEALEARLRQDPELRQLVADAVAEAKGAFGQLRVTQRVIEAERVVGLQAKRLDPGRPVQVEQQVDKGGEVLGAVIDDG
jgi:hypothetical protein